MTCQHGYPRRSIVFACWRAFCARRCSCADMSRLKVRLLLWSAACFVMLAINNLLVVIDLLVFPTGIDLIEERVLASIAGLLMLIYGFIWEAE